MLVCVHEARVRVGEWCGTKSVYRVMFEQICYSVLRKYVLLDASSHDRQQNLVAVVELLVIIPGGVRCCSLAPRQRAIPGEK